jgi:hypothetical protein
MLDLRTFGIHVLRPSQAILFGPRSALLTRLNGKSAALPQIPATKARERNSGICTSRINKGIKCYESCRADRSAHTLVQIGSIFIIVDHLPSPTSSFPRRQSCLRPTSSDGNRNVMDKTFLLNLMHFWPANV